MADEPGLIGVLAGVISCSAVAIALPVIIWRLMR